VCVQPGGEKGSIAAFDRRTGQVAWHALSDVSGYSSPVAAMPAGVHQIICFTGVGVVGLRPADGGRLWQYPWSTANYGNIATPIVAGDYVFISSAYSTGCALLHLNSGKSGAVEVEPVYVKRNKLMRNHHSTCILHGDYLYGFDDNILKCVDLRGGQEKWSNRSVGKGCVLYADGHLIVLSEDGTLSLVEATPAGFRQKGKLEKILQGSDCWSLPALAGGRLYLRDHTQLICLDVTRTKGRKDQPIGALNRDVDNLAKRIPIRRKVLGPWSARSTPSDQDDRVLHWSWIRLSTFSSVSPVRCFRSSCSSSCEYGDRPVRLTRASAATTG